MGFPNDGDRLTSRWLRVSAKGLQPRVVLGLLVIGSFAGIWTAHWGQPLLLRGVLWLAVVSLGALVGGLYWRLVLFDGTMFDDATARGCVRARWHQLETACVWAVVPTGLLYLVVSDVASRFEGIVLGVAVLSLLAPWFVVRYSSEVSRWTRTYPRSVLFLLGFASLTGVSWLETGTTLVDWAVRFGHFTSFSLWIGGAVWHNFVVLPTVTSLGDAATPLKSQARMFRRHLPLVILLLALTGLYQTVQLVGVQVSPFLQTGVGRLIGFKVLVLVVLTSLVLVNLRRSSRTG